MGDLKKEVLVEQLFYEEKLLRRDIDQKVPKYEGLVWLPQYWYNVVTIL